MKQTDWLFGILVVNQGWWIFTSIQWFKIGFANRTGGAPLSNAMHWKLCRSYSTILLTLAFYAPINACGSVLLIALNTPSGFSAVRRTYSSFVWHLNRLVVSCATKTSNWKSPHLLILHVISSRPRMLMCEIFFQVIFIWNQFYFCKIVSCAHFIVCLCYGTLISMYTYACCLTGTIWAIS